MIRRQYHYLLLLAAFCALLASLALFGREKPTRTRTTGTKGSEGELGGLAEMPDFSPRAVKLWRALETETAESGHCELFTPPAMYRDSATNRFVLIQPIAKNRNKVIDDSFVDARQYADGAPEPAFAPRIHLLGYVQRAAGDIVGVFQNLETSEVCVSGSGALPAGWNAAVENLQLDSPRLNSVADSTTVILPRPKVTVRDDAEGLSYALSIDDCIRVPEAETSKIGTAQEIALSQSATLNRDH